MASGRTDLTSGPLAVTNTTGRSWPEQIARTASLPAIYQAMVGYYQIGALLLRGRNRLSDRTGICERKVANLAQGNFYRVDDEPLVLDYQGVHRNSPASGRGAQTRHRGEVR